MPSQSSGTDERRLVGQGVHSLPESQALTSGRGAWGWGSRVREDVSGNDGTRPAPTPQSGSRLYDVFGSMRGSQSPAGLFISILTSLRLMYLL